MSTPADTFYSYEVYSLNNHVNAYDDLADDLNTNLLYETPELAEQAGKEKLVKVFMTEYVEWADSILTTEINKRAEYDEAMERHRVLVNAGLASEEPKALRPPREAIAFDKWLTEFAHVRMSVTTYTLVRAPKDDSAT